ncbi:MAG: FprA family A-type flavoprotein [Anaerolineae bacterium]|nr:FprA family A-type flavoprotein [Anaerolineae bacterium]
MSSILVLYHSQEHGNTGKMAQAVAEGARDAGADVVLFNTNEGRYDIEQYRAFNAVAFGTPDYFSYFAGTLKVFLDDWYIAKLSNAAGLTGKPYALFFSHGGGGAARSPFEKLFAQMGTQIGTIVTSAGTPSATVVAACRELGRKLAGAI